MKRIPKFLASGAVLTLSSTFFAPAAAADVHTEENSDRVSSVVPAVAVQQEAGHLVLLSSQGEEVLLVDDGRTVEEVLQDADLETYKFHAENETKLDRDQVIGSGETVTLYRKETTGVSEEVDIKRTTVEEETDDLLVGETEVVEEGQDGKAIKTTLTTSSANNIKETVEEKFTVVEQPKPKVIKVGTAEPEEEAPEEEPEEDTASTESTSDSGASSNTSGNSSSSSSSSNTGGNSSSSASHTSNSSSSSSSSSNSGSSSSSSSSQSSQSSARSSEAGNQKIASLARAQLGKPYIWGAEGPSSFDCSGLVQYVMNQAGKSVPRTTGAQWAASTPVNPSNIQVGDILWRPGHIGIYVGDGTIVHASSPTTGTIEASLSDWLNRDYKIGRL